VSQPFIKCPGGKTQLLPAILERLPATCNRYFEPFVGGGAVFFALAREQYFKRAFLGDVNPELIETYLAVQNEGLRLETMRELARLKWSEDDYYRVRARRPKTLPKRAARFLYLNRSGYNGLTRVNKKGLSNVPFGHHKTNPIKPALFIRLCAAAAALRCDVTLEAGAFDVVVGNRPKAGDVIYLDPPYLPVAKSSFSAYHASGFGVQETELLARYARSWAKRGAHVLLSNSDTPEVRSIFHDFDIERVQARRNINSKGHGRGFVGELLIQPRGQR
jgi:DNA adenine methylase